KTPHYAPAVTETFTYVVVDSGKEGSPTLTSTECTVTINVQVVNQPPIAVGFEYRISEGTLLDIPFGYFESSPDSATYFDVDGSVEKTTVVISESLVTSEPGKQGTLTGPLG